MELVTLEPPRIVVERPAPCSEQDAESLFAAPFTSGSGPYAPGPGWTLRVRVKKVGATLKAEGELLDASSATVAQRRFSTTGASCAPLARAFAVWGSVVLDEERARAVEADPDGAEQVPAARTVQTTSASGVDGEPPITTVWPKPADPDRRTAEHDLVLRHPSDDRSFEIGGSGFLMNAGDIALAGASIFVMAELAGGFFLRPRVIGARSDGPLKGESQAARTLLAARVDACVRFPGLYEKRRGIQLDGCIGIEGGGLLPEGGIRTRDTLVTAYAVGGPGVGLRGEFATDMAAEVRGEALVGSAAGKLAGGARGEVALTWRLR